MSSWTRFESSFSWHRFLNAAQWAGDLPPMLPHTLQKTFQKLFLISLTFGLHGWGRGSHSYKVFRMVQKWERLPFDHRLSGSCPLAIIILTNFFPSQSFLPDPLGKAWSEAGVTWTVGPPALGQVDSPWPALALCKSTLLTGPIPRGSLWSSSP